MGVQGNSKLPGKGPPAGTNNTAHACSCPHTHLLLGFAEACQHLLDPGQLQDRVVLIVGAVIPPPLQRNARRMSQEGRRV